MADKGHKKHLCSLVAGADGIQTLAKLATDARFICRTCGRVAVKKKYLCKPKSLKDVLADG